jgi:hypothetical protein
VKRILPTRVIIRVIGNWLADERRNSAATSPCRTHDPKARPRIPARPVDHHAFTLTGLSITILLALAGCATNDPLRDPALAWDGQVVIPRLGECDKVYSNTDGLIWQEMQNPDTSVESRAKLDSRVEKIIAPQLNDTGNPKSRCWKASYENHQDLPAPDMGLVPAPGYDLLYAEFDDQGERTDVSRTPIPFERSEIALIESRLENLATTETHNGGGLNIVVFTHGWHGNAEATNDYSIWFKAILEQVTQLERTSRRSLCQSNRQQLGEPVDHEVQDRLRAQGASLGCPSPDEKGLIAFKERRTVGIELAWRGDSEIIPLLTWANFWDRKGAAQSASHGAMDDFMARLHKFYLARSCHASQASRTSTGAPCDAVHLLTVGHSFGALIDYHALSSDIATGLLGDHVGRAYGFGDMTVLLNPAFEGERESTLIDAAIHHSRYPAASQEIEANSKDQSGWPSKAQIPTLVTLQSNGDWATHYAFPFARFFTGFFENTPGAHEYVRSLAAAGWIQYYKTHELTPGSAGGKDNCDFGGLHPAWFCPFDLLHEGTALHPLTLTWAATHEWPDYVPLWTVKVDTSIMKDHDDISNPSIVHFIAQLFRAAYEQEDLLHQPLPSAAPPR